MKVAFVCQPLDGTVPPARNSTAIVIYELARHLASHEGVEVHVFCVGHAWKPATVEDEGVFYQQIPRYLDDHAKNFLRRMPRRNADPLKPLFAYNWAYPAYAWQIATRTHKLGIDIVQITNFSQFVPLLRTMNPEVKIIMQMGCDWLSQLSAEIIEPRLAQTDLVLGCADFISNRVAERFPQYKERCATLYNGIDIQRFGGSSAETATEDHKILYVGRVSPEKGIHVLLDAMSIVVQQFPNAKLELIGGVGNIPKEYVMNITDDPLVKELMRFYGPDGRSNYRESLERQVDQHGLQDKVHFAGFVPNSEMHERLQSASVLVFPSVWEEPFGIPPIEAMAMGIPPIVSRSGGMAETVVHEQTGLIVERNDAKDLAQAIVRILENPEFRAKLGKGGRERARETFSYNVIAQRLHDFHQGLMENPSPSSGG